MAVAAVKGKFATLAFGGTTLACVNWTLPLNSNVEDTSNFRDGRQRTPTLDDVEPTFTVIPEGDSTLPGTTLLPGAYGTLKCFIDNAASKFYQLVVCVGQASMENSGVNNTLRYSVTAGLHGTIAYPA
jgi:hypothetical protein